MPKSGEPEKKNWSDLDVDKNGTLSATEAAPSEPVAVFAKADANADGELTQDEYKAYLAASGKGEASRVRAADHCDPQRSLPAERA